MKRCKARAVSVKSSSALLFAVQTDQQKGKAQLSPESSHRAVVKVFSYLSGGILLQVPRRLLHFLWKTGCYHPEKWCVKRLEWESPVRWASKVSHRWYNMFIKDVNILFCCDKACIYKVSVFSQYRKQTHVAQSVHDVKIHWGSSQVLRLFLPYKHYSYKAELSFSAIEKLNSSDSKGCAGMTKTNQAGLLGSL